MKYRLLLAVPLLAGCQTLQSFDVGGMAGGSMGDRLKNVDVTKVAKGVQQLRKGFEDISESEEYYIGRAVAAQVLSRYKPLNDPGLNNYAQKVMQGVALASDRPATFKGYHLQVLDSDEVNAFAAPGGFVFVTKGLLKHVKSEDELAAVLGHEVAHVAKKHGLKTIQTARLTSAFTILGSEVGKQYTPAQIGQLTTAFEGAIDDVVNKLVVNGYSRDKEYEADKLGAQYAKSAHYDPGALKSFLTRLEKAEGSGGGMFKTHPSAAKRQSELGDQTPAPGYKKSSERGRRFSEAVQL
ncbi:MAG: M48 family metalloprotease [Elusimicrobiota bacterium]|nr:MAG: M48 family metalloprotease [Elusimicrobiota bacterium]